jgi:hypothetical protein
VRRFSFRPPHHADRAPPGIPIALRVVYRRSFVRGPFHLGAFSFPVAFLAVAWILFISIAFILPELAPVDAQTLNYAVVAVGIVLVYSLGLWVVSARRWFTGPVKQIVEERQAAVTTEDVAWEGDEKK